MREARLPAQLGLPKTNEIEVHMKRFFIISLFLFAALLSGCAQTAPDLPEDAGGPDPLPAELTFSEDVFSHSRSSPDAVCYSWLDAQMHQFCVDDANAVFFASDPIVSSTDDEHGSHSVYTATGASGARLIMEYNSVSMQSLYYCTPWYVSKAELLVRDYPADTGAFGMNNVDELPREELAFAAARDAEAAVKEALERLGCGNIGAAEVYSLSPATLAALEQDYPRRGDQGEYLPPQSWTEEDTCYYLRFRCEYGGLVFSREDCGTDITAYYSARGMERLEIRTPLEVTGTGEKIEMPSAEDAKAMVTRKYDSIILTDDLTVEEISLEYAIAPGGGKLVPSWRVIISETIVSEELGEFQNRFCIRFDALTGKQMTQ